MVGFRDDSLFFFPNFLILLPFLMHITSHFLSPAPPDQYNCYQLSFLKTFQADASFLCVLAFYLPQGVDPINLVHRLPSPRA